jgi:SAM-dependent methyltransferase
MRLGGYEVHGVEISADACANCASEYGLEVTRGRVEDLQRGTGFDAVTMVGVIEHLLNPVASLTAIKRLLRPGGVRVLDFPDLSSLEARLCGWRWWGLDLPRHVVHFTPSSAAQLARRAGFTPIARSGTVRTWFHNSILSPPLRRGIPQRSARGLLVKAAAAMFLVARRRPLGILVCQ